MSKRICVASSWRNPHQQEVVSSLRAAGHEVYDFRNPSTGGPRTGPGLDGGFHWSDIDPAWERWSAADYREKLYSHPLAAAGFERDMAGLEWCDTCVLVLPCGRSAHLEAGWAVGAGKIVIALLLDAVEPELMYRMATDIALNIPELVAKLAPSGRGIRAELAGAGEVSRGE